MAENDQDIENLNSRNQDGGAEGGNIQEDDGQEDLDSLALGDDEDVETLKENNRKLFARAKKAEGFVQDKEGNWVKKPKTAPKPADNASGGDGKNQPPAENSDPFFNDELRLTARGFSDEEIAKARVIAKGAGVSLLEAIKDPMFVQFQEGLREADKKEKAKLGASRGSGQHEDKPKFRTGMTREEHKAAWDAEREAGK